MGGLVLVNDEVVKGVERALLDNVPIACVIHDP